MSVRVELRQTNGNTFQILGVPIGDAQELVEDFQHGDAPVLPVLVDDVSTLYVSRAHLCSLKVVTEEVAE